MGLRSTAVGGYCVLRISALPVLAFYPLLVFLLLTSHLLRGMFPPAFLTFFSDSVFSLRMFPSQIVSFPLSLLILLEFRRFVVLWVLAFSILSLLPCRFLSPFLLGAAAPERSAP